MSKKTEKKTARWAKTPQRGLDLRVPVYVTDEMVADVESILLNLVPGASNGRLTDSLSRYPWKDPEIELDLDKIAVASSEEVYAEVIGDWPKATGSEVLEEKIEGTVTEAQDERLPAIDQQDLDRIPTVAVAGEQSWWDDAWANDKS